MVNLNSAENARLYNTNINQIGQVLKFKKTRQNAMVNLHSAENAHFKLWPITSFKTFIKSRHDIIE